LKKTLKKLFQTLGKSRNNFCRENREIQRCNFHPFDVYFLCGFVDWLKPWRAFRVGVAMLEDANTIKLIQFKYTMLTVDDRKLIELAAAATTTAVNITTKKFHKLRIKLDT
jgi:hypothetical protein